MNPEDLLNKRCIPAVNKMYEIAESAFPPEQKVTPTWELMSAFSASRDGQLYFPFDAFWISEKDFDRILDEAKKNLRGWWRYPNAIDEGFGEWCHARNEIAAKADAGEISRYEARKELNRLAKEYGCYWYSKDKSDISFFLCLGSPTPTSNRKTMLEIRDMYAEFLELVGKGLTPDEAADKVSEGKPDHVKRHRQTVLDMWTFWNNYSKANTGDGKSV